MFNLHPIDAMRFWYAGGIRGIQKIDAEVQTAPLTPLTHPTRSSGVLVSDVSIYTDILNQTAPRFARTAEIAIARGYPASNHLIMAIFEVQHAGITFSGMNMILAALHDAQWVHGETCLTAFMEHFDLA